MVRMGHANPRAALIYQHATAERDRAIAQALSELAVPSQKSPGQKVSSSPKDNGEESAATMEGSGPRDGRAMEGPENGTEAPERASDLERTTGFEPATPTLARLCSTS